MFTIEFAELFDSSFKKIILKDKSLIKKVDKAIQLLATNPKYPSLRSHSVKDKFGNEVWSSWVTGDIRIIWKYDKDKKLIILLINIGGHSGKNSVY